MIGDGDGRRNVRELIARYRTDLRATALHTDSTGFETHERAWDPRGIGANYHAMTQRASLVEAEGKIHRVDSDFGSTLTVSNTDSQSNCWVNWKLWVNPVDFRFGRERSVGASAGLAADDAHDGGREPGRRADRAHAAPAAEHDR
jgi:hypothetical protein